MAIESAVVTTMKNQKRLRIFSALCYTVGANLVYSTENRYVVWGSRIFFLTMISGATFSVFGCFFFGLQHTNNLVMFTESITVASQLIIGIAKLVFLFRNQHRFRALYNAIIDHNIVFDAVILQEDLLSTQRLQLEVQKILNKSWNTAMGQVNFFLCDCICITGFYFFSAIIRTIYYVAHEIKDATYAHVFPSAYPFWTENHNDFPYYAVFFTIDSIADYVAGAASVVFDGLFIIMALHAVGLIKILKKMIRFVAPAQITSNSRLAYLKSCIDFHDKVFDFCNEINSLYSNITLMQFAASLLELCIVIFVASVGLENDKAMLIKMIVYLMAAGYELLLYCLNGQKIITETEELPNVWYATDWYNESKEYNDIIYMMILRDNKPVIFWAYGWINLSFTTFVQIINTSTSYFLVLRNMMK